MVTRGCKPIYSEEFAEDEDKECRLANKEVGTEMVINLGYPSAMLDTIPQYKLADSLREAVETIKPDVVYIPHYGDVHKDHKIVSAASMVAVRPGPESGIKRVMAYEVISETDWDMPAEHTAFVPNVFEDISDFLDVKKRAMCRYGSQLHEYPSARSIGAIEALARHRGAVVGVEAAEAFMMVREVNR